MGEDEVVKQEANVAPVTYCANHAATPAALDDYLCEPCRDTVDGISRCPKCQAKITDGLPLCTYCRTLDECDCCKAMYQPPVFKGKGFGQGKRFKGLCTDCHTIACESVPPLFEEQETDKQRFWPMMHSYSRDWP